MYVSTRPDLRDEAETIPFRRTNQLIRIYGCSDKSLPNGHFGVESNRAKGGSSRRSICSPPRDPCDRSRFCPLFMCIYNDKRV